MKTFELPAIYRGQQIFKIVCAKSTKEAAQKLGVSEYTVRNWCSHPNMEEFEGIQAYVDSGRVVFTFDRRDLIRKKMPLEELEKIIDHYDDLYNKTWKEQHIDLDKKNINDKSGNITRK